MRRLRRRRRHHRQPGADQRTDGADGAAALDLKLHGLKGGHSGIDIFLQRGNAIQLMARALHAVSRDHAVRLAAFAGGTAHNAIPREAFATAVVAAADRDAVVAALEAQAAAIARELKTVEPDIALSVDDAEAPAECWDEATQPGAHPPADLAAARHRRR